MESVSIFYESTSGILSQWSGKIVQVNPTSITILRHKQEINFDLLKSNFLLVTINHVKDMELGKYSKFNVELRQLLTDTFIENTYILWNGIEFLVNKSKTN